MSLQINKILSKDSVLSPVLCFSKKRLLEIIAKKAAILTGVDECVLLKELNLREKMGSTFVGNGFALPHTIIPKDYPETAVFVILNHSVHYSHFDNSYADCFLALFLHEQTVQENEEQIQCICSTLSDVANCRYIRNIRDIQNQVYNAIITFCTPKEENNEE